MLRWGGPIHLSAWTFGGTCPLAEGQRVHLFQGPLLLDMRCARARLHGARKAAKQQTLQICPIPHSCFRSTTSKRVVRSSAGTGAICPLVGGAFRPKVHLLSLSCPHRAPEAPSLHYPSLELPPDTYRRLYRPLPSSTPEYAMLLRRNVRTSLTTSCILGIARWITAALEGVTCAVRTVRRVVQRQTGTRNMVTLNMLKSGQWALNATVG